MHISTMYNPAFGQTNARQIRLAVFDGHTSEVIDHLTITAADIDGGRLFRAFEIAYALGAYQVYFDKPIPCTLAKRGRTSCNAVITVFPGEAPGLWFCIDEDADSYSDAITASALAGKK